MTGTVSTCRYAEPRWTASGETSGAAITSGCNIISKQRCQRSCDAARKGVCMCVGFAGEPVSGGRGTRSGGCCGGHEALPPASHCAAQRPFMLHSSGPREHYDAGMQLGCGVNAVNMHVHDPIYWSVCFPLILHCRVNGACLSEHTDAGSSHDCNNRVQKRQVCVFHRCNRRPGTRSSTRSSS